MWSKFGLFPVQWNVDICGFIYFICIYLYRAFLTLTLPNYQLHLVGFQNSNWFLLPLIRSLRCLVLALRAEQQVFNSRSGHKATSLYVDCILFVYLLLIFSMRFKEVAYFNLSYLESKHSRSQYLYHSCCKLHLFNYTNARSSP